MQGHKKSIPVQALYTISLLLLLVACTQSPKQNRLSKASSPYLLEHADNPVDWYEWGDEALTKAKKENKPLLVSIGYASCHWCHVMERESFMDTAVARIMNENFVNIKVDREERPDIDNIYMNACQLITGGSGGWPLNAFALPDGKPFFAGTYYSKESWTDLLLQISKAYRSQYKKVVLQADALTNEISYTDFQFLQNKDSSTSIGKNFYKNFFDSLYLQIDLKNGGLKGFPKFPTVPVWEFFLQYYYHAKDEKALNATNTTLKKMASGGIYDHIGGGFARYSTDSVWHIPHFEKMLYDNGQLMSLYSHAYQVTHNELFRNIVNGISVFIERDLASPDGGFYSSVNADTKEGEGQFYAWTFNDLKKVLGEKEGELLAKYFDVSASGNWETTKNILHTSYSPENFALSNKLLPADFNSLLQTAKQKLLEERNKRTRPSVDDKILTSWNALVLKGYVDAYAAFGDESFLKKALNNATFLEKNMLTSNGHLWRNYKDGKATIDGFLDDYALLIWAYIRLYEVTFDKHWLSLAQDMTNYAIDKFYDNETGMFYYNSAGPGDVVLRKMEIVDDEIPSSNAIMAEVLYKLGIYFENESYIKKSELMIKGVAGKAASAASYYSQWAGLGGLLTSGTYEIAVMGQDAISKNLKLQNNYLPACIYMGSINMENLPLLENKLADGKTLIYVCSNKVCKYPVEEVEKALLQIKK